MLTTSSSPNYQIGDLSSFPEALDDLSVVKGARNNAISSLAAPLGWNSDVVFLSDASLFPTHYGFIRINDEIALFTERSGNTLKGVMRGLMNTTAARHASGSPVIAPFAADMHNAIRDIVLKAETKIGFRNDPASSSPEASLWARINHLKKKWFSAKARFYAHNNVGHAPLGVQFYDFSIGEPVRWFWDFGDGSVSNEQHPFHVYEDVGVYDVGLTIFTLNNQNLISSTAANQGVGVIQKKGYVEVLDEIQVQEVVFYAKRIDQDGVEVPSLYGPPPLTIRFYDQTRGDIRTRIWNFGDGQSEVVEDSSQYFAEHTYLTDGVYRPNLAVSDGASNFKKNLTTTIKVISDRRL